MSKFLKILGIILGIIVSLFVIYNNIKDKEKILGLSPIKFLLAIIFIVILIVILIIVIELKRKIRPPRPGKFPFDRVLPEDLSTYLEKAKKLTETKNKYTVRQKKEIHKLTNIDTTRRRIIIFGRADIGKTREAQQMITTQLLIGSDPGEILFPSLNAVIPYDFSEQCIPADICNKAVVIFYDDFPNIYSSTVDTEKAKLETSQDRLKKVIECISSKTNQCHFIATARQEMLDRLKGFDYKNDSFWNTFEIFELEELNYNSEIEMIRNLVSLYKISADENTIKRIHDKNRGYACESIVTFLQSFSGKQLTKKEVDDSFEKTAYIFWNKNTYEPLKQKEPQIEEIYKIFSFFRFQLNNTVILESNVLILTEELIKKKTKGLFKRTGEKVTHLIKYLEEHGAISIKEDVISIPDFQLDPSTNLDINEQIDILIKNKKKVCQADRNAIADSLVDIAYYHIDKKEYNLAITNYTKSIELNPKFVEAYLNRGNAYSHNSEPELALVDYNKAIELNPKLAIAYYNRGYAFINKNEPELALVDYNKAIELNPKYAEAYNNRGNIYTDRGELDLAFADYTKAIEVNPKLKQAYFNRGRSYYNKKEYDLAIADLTNGIKLDSKDPNAYFNRGNAYANKEKFNLAIEDFSKTINLDPKYTDAYNNRGNSYNKKGEYDLALADYSKAIELDSKNANAYYNRGLNYNEKDELDKAIEDFNRTIELNPEHADAYCHRGCALVKKSNDDKALEDFTKSIQLRAFFCVYNNRGDIYLNKGEYDLAIGDYTKAIELEPNDAGGYNNRGNAYRKQDEYDLAITDFTKVIDLNPNDAQTYISRGYVYTEKGAHDLAIKDYTKVIELDPKNATAYNNGGYAYQNKGEYNLAIRDYTKAIELDPEGAVSRASMGRVNHLQGNKEIARGWYNRSLEKKEQLNEKQIADIQKWLKELDGN
jgi:tetratricopeptide (TPR) repeat protein